MIWQHLLVSCRSECLLSDWAINRLPVWISAIALFLLSFPCRTPPSSPIGPLKREPRPEEPEPLRAHGHSGTLGLSASHEWILVVLQLLYRRAAAAGKIIITSRNQEELTLFSSITCSCLFLFPCWVPSYPLIFYICLSFSLLLDLESTYNVSQGCFHHKRLTIFILCVFKYCAWTV